MTDTTGEGVIDLRRTAQRFADLCRLLAPLMRPNETPEEAVTRLVTP